MMQTLIQLVTAPWRRLVGYHRRHLDDDPDVQRLRQQGQQVREASRDFSETLAVPPVWRQGRD